MNQPRLSQCGFIFPMPPATSSLSFSNGSTVYWKTLARANKVHQVYLTPQLQVTCNIWSMLLEYSFMVWKMQEVSRKKSFQLFSYCLSHFLWIRSSFHIRLWSLQPSTHVSTDIKTDIVGRFYICILFLLGKDSELYPHATIGFVKVSRDPSAFAGASDQTPSKSSLSPIKSDNLRGRGRKELEQETWSRRRRVCTAPVPAGTQSNYRQRSEPCTLSSQYTQFFL